MGQGCFCCGSLLQDREKDAKPEGTEAGPTRRVEQGCRTPQTANTLVSIMSGQALRVSIHPKTGTTHVSNWGVPGMSATLTVTPAAEITARLDRLPMTRHIWGLAGCGKTLERSRIL
jgi:hypothetical protein